MGIVAEPEIDSQTRELKAKNIVELLTIVDSESQK